ncbi:MAG: dephospho-CoA kinase [Flavobacteriales bacterium]|nr:dephospho-CoA kinase [Flavobacteriales bacterium]
MKHPYKIGLTGGIGVGKTTISQILKTLQIPVFNSDLFAKKLYTNTHIVSVLKKTFGNTIISGENIDTNKLAHIVFNNKKHLETLNNIIHPIVLRNFNDWYKKQTTHYIIKESALLFESETNKNLDKIILVHTPLKLRINRIIKRDKRTQEEIKKIIKNQLQYKQIKHKADYIITNNEKKLLTPQILKIHNEIMQL